MSLDDTRKITAAQLLATGKDYDEVGAAVGVSGRTVRRWHDDGAFKREVTQLQDAIFSTLAAKFVDATSKALEIATAVLDDDSTKTAQKLRAAEFIARHALSFREQAQIGERVAALEALFDGDA